MASYKTADAWAQALSITPKAVQAMTSDRHYAIWINGSKSGESDIKMRWFSITGQDGQEHILNVSKSAAEAVAWANGGKSGAKLLKEALKDRVIKDFLDDDGNTRWCICLPGGEACSTLSTLDGSFGF